MEYDIEPGSILVAGTFNGNPLVTAAGTAVLRRLSKEPQLYARLNAMGDRFRDEINRFAQERDFPAIATGVGSMFWMHPVRGPVNSVRDVRQANRIRQCWLEAAVPQEWAAHIAQSWVHEHRPHRRGYHPADRDP